MGKTFSTGLLTNGVFQDASNNIGIGAAPSGTYKLEVTGTAKVSSTLLLGGALTGTNASFVGTGDFSSGALTLTLGADNGLTTRTNATQKIAKIVSYNYTNANNPVGMMVANNDGTDNALWIGGGSGATIAATNIQFYTAANNNTATGTPRMTITSSGNVGIGTATPSSFSGYTVASISGTSGGILDLMYNGTSQLRISAESGANYISGVTNAPLYFYTNSALRLTIASTGAATFSSSAASNIIFNSTNANGGYLSFQRSGTACGYIGSGYHIATGGSNTDLALANDAGNILFVTGGSFTERMRITSGGNVGIGDSGAATVRFQIKSGGSTSASYAIITRDSANADLLVIRDDGYGYLKAAAWAYGSDRRIKKNISYIETGIDKVMALKPATFDYIDGVKNNIGWIAQDVQEIIPEAVGTISETNDQLTLKSDFIVPFLVKAIQEQQIQIQNLQEQNQDLKSRLDKAGL